MYKKIFFLLNILIVVSSLFSITIYDYLEKAEESLVHQNYYKAVEYFKEALNINLNDIQANKGLSDSFFMLKEYDESLIYINKSITLDKNNLEFKNTKGRILTAIENYDAAEEEYYKVLEVEMYNVGAKSGLAELRIVKGDLKGSLYDFENILKFSPNSRRLLLSLVVLYDEQGEYDKSNDIIQKAIRFYPDDPVVLETAVRHYMKFKSYSGASLYMDELLSLSENNEIKILNAELLIKLGNFQDALDSLTEYIKINKDNPEAYYMASVVLDNLSEGDKALSLISLSIDLKPDEEIYRFYSEMIMDDLYLLKDEKRINYSGWYLDQGKLLEGRYYYNKAKTYYQRGIEIDPFNNKLRLAYADIQKKMGFKQRYIKELELVLNQNADNKELNDILLIENSLPKNELYNLWGGEKWNYNDSFSISTFINNEIGENHLNSSKVLKAVANRFLSGKKKFYTDKIELYSGSFSDAFNSSRESSSDYFLTLKFSEGNRTFWLQGKLFLTSNGRELKTFTYLKTGNNKIFNAFENLSSELNSFLPILGSVMDIKSENVLLNIGMEHNITNEYIFDVVKKGNYFLIPDNPFLDYNKNQHLGSVQIKNVGEAMSDGIFTPDNSFNLLNIGDNIIFIPQDENNTKSNDLYNEITDTELIKQLLMVN